jgi:hypothetical protein
MLGKEDVEAPMRAIIDRPWQRRLMSLLLSGLPLLFPNLIYAEDQRAELRGEYHYIYGDHQTPDQARQIVCAMAVRKAIESSPVFLEDTATVNDPALLKTLTQTIASGYLENLETLQQTEEGRRVLCKVRAFIEPGVMKTVINRELVRLQGKEPDVVDENKHVKILHVEDYKVEDTKKKKILREIKVVYQQVSSDSTQILIDFYDAKGHPIPGKRSTTQEFLLPGEIRQVVFTMPDDARSYRVWLRK